MAAVVSDLAFNNNAAAAAAEREAKAISTPSVRPRPSVRL